MVTINAKRPSPNYGSRNGRKILGIVIHVSEGSMESMDNHFSSRKSQVSAHYGISKEGKIHQYVLESHAAWANGRVLRPTARLVLEHPGVNPNFYTLSIEHEGDGKSDFTPKQYEVSALLIADLARRYDLPINLDTVIPHRAIYAGKTCPGPVDMKKLVGLAQGGGGHPPIGSQGWSNYLDSNLTLVDWVGPKEWYYTVNRDPLRYGILKAQVPWSNLDPPREETP